MCRSGCPTNDHENWGACARAACFQIDKHGLSDAGATDRRKEKQIKEYQSVRKEGIQPAGWKPSDLDHARRMTEKTGVPYQA